MGDLLCFILLLAFYTILAWVILSYVVSFGRLPWGHPVRRIYDAINRVLQPILLPIRRVIRF